MLVYSACVVSTLMYGNEMWTTYARQEKRLNSFDLRSIHHVLGISWQDRVSSTEVLSQANLPSMFTLLRQGRLHWLGHVYRMEEGRIPKDIRMEDGRIPKDILYVELASGTRTRGHPQLRYNDVCKRDMKALDINTESWEDLAADRLMWRNTLNQHLKTGEEKLVNAEVRKGPVASSATPTDQRPLANATFVAEIVSSSTATSNAATIEQTGQPEYTPMIKLDGQGPY